MKKKGRNERRTGKGRTQRMGLGTRAGLKMRGGETKCEARKKSKGKAILMGRSRKKKKQNSELTKSEVQAVSGGKTFQFFGQMKAIKGERKGSRGNACPPGKNGS